MCVYVEVRTCVNVVCVYVEVCTCVNVVCVYVEVCTCVNVVCVYVEVCTCVLCAYILLCIKALKHKLAIIRLRTFELELAIAPLTSSIAEYSPT